MKNSAIDTGSRSSSVAHDEWTALMGRLQAQVGAERGRPAATVQPTPRGEAIQIDAHRIAADLIERLLRQ